MPGGGGSVESRGVKVIAKNSKAYHDYFIEENGKRTEKINCK